MATGDPVQELCEELACPICLEHFEDPVMLTECGHNFCRACLTQSWGASGAEAPCPVCKQTVQPGSLRPNRQLANVVEIAKKLSLQERNGGAAKKEEAKERICAKHREPLKLFCQTDGILICTVCDRSKEHKHHEVVPAEEASQEYKDVRSTLQRCEEMENFKNPKAFPSELKRRLQGCCDIGPFLAGVIKQFKANVTLDPSAASTTANAMLILSDDRRSITCQSKDLIEDPESSWKSKLNCATLPAVGAAMAAGGPVQELREEVSCSICLDNFRDPVSIAECGHNFCRACLMHSWRESGAEASCPQCRETAQQRNLKPNRQLANVVEIAKKLSLQGEGGAERKGVEGKEGTCEKHQEPLKLFCKDDQAPICVVCDRSKEHRDHQVVPVEEAAQEYKDQFSDRLKLLTTERKKCFAHTLDIEGESQDLLKQTEPERQKIVDEFRKMHEFLEEKEKVLLAQVEEVEKEIAREKYKHLARLSKDYSCLESLIREMQEKIQQPATKFLQDARSTLQRFQDKQKTENPMPFPPLLKQRIQDICDRNHFLKVNLKQFRDTLVSGLQRQKAANVTLDPDTAHPKLILSDYRKSMRLGSEAQNMPDNPERFDVWPFVLGREGFTRGQHFWEVIVGREEIWAVGVARKSVRRKGDVVFSPEGGIWALASWAGGYWALTHPREHRLSLSGVPKMIRVSLNNDEGRVAFFDAERETLLYEYSDASFSGETIFPFFWVCLNAYLRLFP
uniref:E3 ubiquitin-protein ligase TRIM7-like n=1 Tax=Euleptes europaea TaxID=460621 RepID=UPI00254136D8|nr:E3 ubiquitin-protein ligase TRIM7-like [Euleptes europaea]